MAASMPIRLIPIEGDIVDALKKDFGRYQVTSIPAGAYPGVDTPTPTVGFSALWLVNSRADPDLVYAITKSLWNSATTKLLSAIEPIGSQFRLDRALAGVSVPLHPGAERFYREAGLPVDETPPPPESNNSEDGTKAAAQDERGNDTPLNSDAAKPKEP